MKKLLLLFLSVTLFACSSDDCEDCDILTEAKNYGIHIKTTEETTIHYRLISPYLPMTDNDSGEYIEQDGYYARVFKQGQIIVDGERTLLFPVTALEREYVGVDSYESIYAEVRIINGNKENIEVFWLAENDDYFLVKKEGRNNNAINVFEENICLWLPDGQSGYYSGSILLFSKGYERYYEWVERY